MRATMLILTLKEDEKILIGDKITVMVVEIRGNQIRLGIEAPAGLLVLREKLAGKAKASRSTGGWVTAKPPVRCQADAPAPPTQTACPRPDPRRDRHHHSPALLGPPRPSALRRPPTRVRPPLPAPGGKPGDWDSSPPCHYDWSGPEPKKLLIPDLPERDPGRFSLGVMDPGKIFRCENAQGYRRGIPSPCIGSKKGLDAFCGVITLRHGY